MLKTTLVILSLFSFVPLATQASTSLVSTAQVSASFESKSLESNLQYDAKAICHSVAKALGEDWDECASVGPKLDKQGTTEYVFMTDDGERACRVWTTSHGGQKGFLSPAPVNADECPLGTFFTVKPMSEELYEVDITFGG
ncbi:hypothetical protein FM038_022165 [Shewanella eurypsychrophilus]|uniref:Uncharacterized protein n=1 Tax=Shewanella eurypsychrophilus TaxID=2593656 RepID=A0ABX6VCQ5_9GAMM|nr:MULTISPECIES: hypothetical protein [Shewanella]QFU24575.1 hypothetical protein FS418_23840 [Shewanella sp. YLB-09]QPG59772.1 hypothetical protein FM038_022165 [Shewanella eurypsychrophilus]